MNHILTSLRPTDDVRSLRSVSCSVLGLQFFFYLYHYFECKMAQWLSGRALDLRSLGCGFDSYQGGRLHNNLGQVVHTYVPLSPSSITSYQSKDGEVLGLVSRPQAWRKVMAAYRRR